MQEVCTNVQAPQEGVTHKDPGQKFKTQSAPMLAARQPIILEC